ncbi:MAG: phosphatase PAP2 family protein, partial [Alistipes sp.]|nr:phosphatase PAP2 family protein [Alistipes sp.]
AVAGRYGTVSAHAATIVALAVLSASVFRRRWFAWLMIGCTLLICYSRIYLAKHFPMDLLWGTLVGLLLGWGAWRIFRRFARL